MPFNIIGRTGPGMRQVVRFGDLFAERGTFRGEFGARDCNQAGVYGVRVRQRRDAALFPNYFGQTFYYYHIICSPINVFSVVFYVLTAQRTLLHKLQYG